jgi:hypothetical protein
VDPAASLSPGICSSTCTCVTNNSSLTDYTVTYNQLMPPGRCTVRAHRASGFKNGFYTFQLLTKFIRVIGIPQFPMSLHSYNSGHLVEGRAWVKNKDTIYQADGFLELGKLPKKSLLKTSEGLANEHGPRTTNTCRKTKRGIQV